MRLLIAGGGTGGHLFPALAIADAVKNQSPDSEIVFVGTKNGIEARILPGTKFPVRFISSRGIRGTRILNMLRAGMQVPWGLLQSIAILHDFKPDFVLGVGGYASGPTVAAAVLMRIPCGIQEQNSVMGTTNKLLMRFVDTVFTSWEKTEPEPPAYKNIRAGNPIRKNLLSSEKVEKPSNTFNLLVFGGSRGAHSINSALKSNLYELRNLHSGLRIVHQTGAAEVEELKLAYDQAGIDAEVRSFIDDMGQAYRWADLVICRSGASSLAELTAFGKPAIVIPYPHAIGDHQAKNAAVLETAGAVRVIPDHALGNGALMRELNDLIRSPDTLKELALNSANIGRPDAADHIAARILQSGRSRT